MTIEEKIKEFRIMPLQGERNRDEYYVFVKAIDAGIQFDKVAEFSDVAKYVMNEINKKGKFQGFLDSRSVIVKVPSGINYIFPKGRPDIFGYVKTNKTFLEGVGNCDYQMGNWLTGSEIFDKVDKTNMYAYKPELGFEKFSNQTWYNNKEMIAILEQSKKNVSDLELLTALMNGNTDLAKEFMNVTQPNVLDLHRGGTGHNHYITLLAGIYANKKTNEIEVFTSFADEGFRFLYKD